jgi:hypothetical protein
MGSGQSALEANISIELDKNNSTVYHTGELVSGTAKFQNDAQFELKLKNIFVELVGELVYITTRGSGHSKTTDIHVVSFFTERQIVRSTDTKNDFVLEPGSHTWPFTLRLHDALPSTLEQTRYQGPYVRYVVRVQLILSEWYKNNIQKASFITVQGHSPSIPIVKSEDKSKNGKDVQLHAFFQINTAITGENLSLCVDLHNPNRATITCVSLTLIQERLLGPAGREEVVLRKQDLNDIHNFQEEQWHGKYEFRAPEKVVPTCSCMPPQWSARKPLVVSYELHLEAHVHGLCTNVHLRLPLTIINPQQEVTDKNHFLT